MKKGAVIDPTGVYRYSLWREWNPDAAPITFIMLNPSRADATNDDPTIRRCINLASSWGYGYLEVVNLFGYRTSHPQQLKQVDDPVGADNDRYLKQAASQTQTIVLAWGNEGTFKKRNQTVLQQLANFCPLYCLGITKKLQPRHPLYLRNDTILQHYHHNLSFNRV